MDLTDATDAIDPIDINLIDLDQSELTLSVYPSIHPCIDRSIFEGSLEAKLPTIWRDENAVQLRRSAEMEKVRREKMQVREKVGKSRNTVFFQCFVAPEGRKVGSLKRRVRRHLGR